MTLNYTEFTQDPNNFNKLVIFLHGYGANGKNLLSLSPELSKTIPNAKFIAPDAPFACDFPGINSYQWFSLQQEDQKKAIEILKSNDILDNFIDEQLKKNNLTKKDLFLIGFSQGSMMSMYNSLKSQEEFAGIISLSGRLILPTDFGGKIGSKQRICLIHGKDDDVVDFDNILYAEKKFTELNIEFESHHLENLDHSIDYRGVKIMQNFIKKLI
jgi:phospholipase/carboxylesterase